MHPIASAKVTKLEISVVSSGAMTRSRSRLDINARASPRNLITMRPGHSDVKSNDADRINVALTGDDVSTVRRANIV
jgi:hypothetical protein